MDNLKEILEFLQEKVRKIAELQAESARIYWKASISGKEEDYSAYEKIQIEFEHFLNNKKDFEKIREFLKEEIEDSLIKRQLEILHNMYLGSQGNPELAEKIIKKSTEIEKKFNVFRAEIDGKKYSDNEIKEILKKETNSEKLRKVWEASKKQGREVSGDILDLVLLRNQLAKSLGFENYYVLKLKADEQDEKEIEKIFEELADLTKKPFKKLKKEIDRFLSKRCGISENGLKPWHYQDLFFQEGPAIYDVNLDEFYSQDVLEIAKRFYSDIGFDVAGILKRSDLYERSGKDQHAYSIDFDRKGDVRILENIKNNEDWMRTTLHELGHAIYSKNHSKSLPYLLRDAAHTFTTEAIAMFFENNARNIGFMEKYCNLGKKELEKVKEKMLKTSRFRILVFSRWSQVMFHFEKELYQNPAQNLNKLWWELVKKYQFIDFYRNQPDWASKIHLACCPGYYHNYLLGELLSFQIQNYIAKNILKKYSVKNLNYSGNSEVGKYIREKIFAQGKRYSWNDMIKNATGEFLTPKYFAEFLNN